MALRLYLDDCAYSSRLADLLRQAGHAVTIPAEVGLSSAPDRQHFSHAASHGLVLVTKNPADFLELHEENQSHPGIIGICQDNDITRDMTYSDIVRAIANLERAYADSGLSLTGDFFELNHWRFASPAGSPPSSAPPSVSADTPPSPPPTSAGDTTRSDKKTRKKRKGRPGK